MAIGTPDDAKARATATYNAAADAYDHPANSFWARFGRNTIDRLDLRNGDHVLDVCCGSGASAIPAAEKVGNEGGVEQAEVVAEAAVHPIVSPEAWWAAVLGTGYRGTVDQLDPHDFERVRAANLDYVRGSAISAVEVNVVYATATKV